MNFPFDVYKLLGIHLYHINDILHYYQVNKEMYTYYTNNMMTILDNAITLNSYINTPLYEQTRHAHYLRSIIFVKEVKNIVISKEKIYSILPKINAKHTYEKFKHRLADITSNITCNYEIFPMLLYKYILCTYGWKTSFYKTKPDNRYKKLDLHKANTWSTINFEMV